MISKDRTNLLVNIFESLYMGNYQRNISRLPKCFLAAGDGLDETYPLLRVAVWMNMDEPWVIVARSSMRVVWRAS